MVYQLAGTMMGDNLSALADAFLTEVGSMVQMDALGKRIAGEGVASGQPLMRRLASTIERLNSMHYQARWEAGAEGPRIILGHCPYRAIIADHPELCQMDAALLTELLQDEVMQTAKLEPAAGGLPFCGFVLI